MWAFLSHGVEVVGRGLVVFEGVATFLADPLHVLDDLLLIAADKLEIDVAALDVTLAPFAFDGTWEIRQINQLRQNGLFVSKGVGHGTGELRGMTINFTTGQFVFGLNPCSPFPSAEVQGVLRGPANID